MDVTLDVSFVLPALFFTLLALMLVHMLYRARDTGTDQESERSAQYAQSVGAGTDQGNEGPQYAQSASTGMDQSNEGSQYAQSVGTGKDQDNAGSPQYAQSVGTGKDPDNAGSPQYPQSVGTVKDPDNAGSPQYPPSVGAGKDQNGRTGDSSDGQRDTEQSPVQELSTKPLPEKKHFTKSDAMSQHDAMPICPENSTEPGFIRGPDRADVTCPDQIPQRLPEALPDSDGAQELPLTANWESVTKTKAAPQLDTLRETRLVDEDDADAAAVAGLESPDVPVKYALGKLRTSQLDEMMTKEELEEEQRAEE